MERLISKENKKMNIWNIKKNHYQLHVFEDCVEVFVKQFLGCFKMKKKLKTPKMRITSGTLRLLASPHSLCAMATNI